MRLGWQVEVLAEVVSGPAKGRGAEGAQAAFDVPGVRSAAARTPTSAIEAGGRGVLTRKEGRDLRIPAV